MAAVGILGCALGGALGPFGFGPVGAAILLFFFRSHVVKFHDIFFMFSSRFFHSSHSPILPPLFSVLRSFSTFSAASFSMVAFSS